jgi:hypothetical protein
MSSFLLIMTLSALWLFFTQPTSSAGIFALIFIVFFLLFIVDIVVKKPLSSIIVACTLSCILIGLIGVVWSTYHKRNVEHESMMSATRTQAVGNLYPKEAIDNYINVCTKGGATPEFCSCFINKAQDVYTLDEIVKISKEVSNGGKNPEKIETILKQCKK